jgi:uncharacterized membrane protein YgdD (TMEM256/DUF423 family)
LESLGDTISRGFHYLDRLAAAIEACRLGDCLDKIFFIIGSLSGALAVMLGAFGSHGLRRRLTAEAMSTFEIGVRYQMYHALAMIAASIAGGQWRASSLPTAAGWLFVIGTLLFSGSLYLLVFTQKRWLGAITPFGGLAFIAGWVCLALSAFSG